LIQHFGVNPIALAQTQRLLFAKKLLQETELPMAQIAYAAGFGSVRRFNALFLSRYGMAPSNLRRSAATSDTPLAETLYLRLAYRPPYDWGSILQYLMKRAIVGVEAVAVSGNSHAYARSVRIGAVTGWMRITHLQDKGLLQLEISSSLAPVLMPLLARVRKQFDLDANPSVIAMHLNTDPVLARLSQANPGMRVIGAFDMFELAVRAVLGQQISVAGATTLSGRLVQKFGEPIQTPIAYITHHFPHAEVLAARDIADLMQIGLPMKRAETIRNLARFAKQGGFNIAPGSALDDVVAQLKTVPGIGDWTAHYIALRAFGFPDAFPAGDLGLQKALAKKGNAHGATSSRLTEKQLTQHAAAWSPWRGYAAFLLWNATGET
jgi:AraC family transcriptional regulator of adaptative response / DNA-3-methyladenine glycosylase II